MKKRETVGSISANLSSQHEQVVDHSSQEQMQEMLVDWDNKIMESVQEGIRKFDRDFFIVVETKKEPLMNNVLRNYFIVRQSCPTPSYDNAVYHYHRSDEHIELLWVLPSKETCAMMKSRSLEIPAEQRELLQFVLDDADGTLLQKSLILNKEIL